MEIDLPITAKTRRGARDSGVEFKIELNVIKQKKMELSHLSRFKQNGVCSGEGFTEDMTFDLNLKDD